MARRSFKYPKYNVTFLKGCTYGELHAATICWDASRGLRAKTSRGGNHEDTKTIQESAKTASEESNSILETFLHVTPKS
eukprot:7312548-Pyramimonas_sp.AAC.1